MNKKAEMDKAESRNLFLFSRFQLSAFD